jgi:hypothetical protein
MKTPDPKHHSGFSLPLLMLSFGVASGLFSQKVEAQDRTTLTTTTIPIPLPGHSFWRHPDCDAVVEVWTDPKTGLRGKIVSLNPADEKIRKAVGKILKKDEEDVTAKDVLSFQGMEGDLHLHREGLKWTGSIYWPFKQKSYGVDVEQMKDALHVHGYLLLLPIFGKSVDLKPVGGPAPQISFKTP